MQKLKEVGWRIRWDLSYRYKMSLCARYKVSNFKALRDEYNI